MPARAPSDRSAGAPEEVVDRLAWLLPPSPAPFRSPDTIPYVWRDTGAKRPKRELIGLHEQTALTVFDQIQVGDGALPVRPPGDFSESALPEQERQALRVVQPLVAVAAEPLLDKPPDEAGRVAVRPVLRAEGVGSGGLFSEQRRPVVAVVADHLFKVGR